MSQANTTPSTDQVQAGGFVPGVMPKNPKFKDLTGMVSSELKVVAFAYVRNHRAYWLCDCSCGRQAIVSTESLVSKNTKSCGHLRAVAMRRAIQANTTHGLSRTPAFVAWSNLISRCMDPRNTAYHNYGGRGVRTCLGWRSFESFHADMGPRPSGRHGKRSEYSVDRKDNNGHYSCGHCPECLEKGWPMNCHWATKAVQVRNTRRNRLLTFRGESKPLVDWATQLGISTGTLHRRLARGVATERALTMPLRPIRSGARRSKAATWPSEPIARPTSPRPSQEQPE